MALRCDRMDGLVVKSAEEALEMENINYVLPFIREKYEDEVKDAFERTLVVRELSGDAAELADYWFFETAVRLHLKGRGISYEGLKPTPVNGEPVIVMADQAVKTENLNDLMNFLLSSIREDVEARFDDILYKKDYDVNDVDDARDYVDAILNFFGYLQTLIEFMEEG
ncbi:DUF6448 family protein [Methanobacterium petrolearium]|uniref:DUF6448 family protein n=1 Tax=Methanobacterium petrolearium TaxID=710190 RepID=UPI001AEA4F4B|nr:DUF6448 family protein [Methanobacterium petrolearium]MBP1946806.1 hypothetical protein [Methanobacterium petrolearium]BDZ69779.1 hypothetical protein GCM10025861_02960 [Methanobacterium petrolearium]